MATFTPQPGFQWMSTATWPVLPAPTFWSNPLDQLNSLWVDIPSLDQAVEQSIEEEKANTISIEEFHKQLDILSQLPEAEWLTDSEIEKFWFDLVRQAWRKVEWVNLDEILEEPEEVIEEEIVEEEIQEWPGLWERIAETWRDVKLKWKEEFWLTQSFKDVWTALVNLPWDTIEWIWEVLGLLWDPVQTFNSFNDMWRAISDKLVFWALNTLFWKDVQEPEKSTQIREALSNELKENFWTPWKAKKTFVENPVDTLFFVKWALNTVSKVTKSSKLANVANKIDPIKLQTTPVKKTISWAKEAVLTAEWKITWLWKEWVKDIVKLWKTPEFWEAIKWQVTAIDVVDDVSSAISKIKSDASTKFGKDLDKILKTWDVKVNFNTQIDDFYKWLENKWVVVSKNKKGKYSVKEWPNTELIEEDLAVIQNITKRVNDKAWDLTWIEARAFTNRIWAEAKKLQDQWILINFRKNLTEWIEKASPWFKEMNRDYRRMITTTKNLEDTFGSPKVKIETKINKLNQALRDNQDYKKFMLEIIEDSSWKNIKWKLAWLAAQEYLPRWLIWQIWAWGWAAALASWASIIPVVLTLWLASPRLLWNLSRTLWIWVDKLNKFINIFSKNAPTWIKAFPTTDVIRTWIQAAWTVWPTLETTE